MVLIFQLNVGIGVRDVVLLWTWETSWDCILCMCVLIVCTDTIHDYESELGLYLRDISFFSMVCFQYISVNYHISTVTGIKLYIFKGNNAHIPLILNINTMYFANNLYIPVNNHGLY